MGEPIDPGIAEVTERIRKAINEEFEPYLQQINEGFQRASHLVRMAKTLPMKSPSDQKAADEIFRSVVVLTHAYLEDFLRTLGKAFLPSADERTLNHVPIVGSGGGHADKFFLGRLAQHRGKLVDDVIRESVEDHLSRSTFNSTTEIVSFLRQIGFDVEDHEKLPAIDAMIKRRHLIVHRADRVEGQIQTVDFNEVLDWLAAAQIFMHSLLKPVLEKYTPQYLAAKLDIIITES